MADPDLTDMRATRDLIARHAKDADEEWELLEILGMT